MPALSVVRSFCLLVTATECCFEKLLLFFERERFDLIVLGFNDTLTLVGHFVLSPR